MTEIDPQRLRHIAEIATARAAMARELYDRSNEFREERDRLNDRIKRLRHLGPDVTGGAGIEIERLEGRIDEIGAERAEIAARLEAVNAELAQARFLETRCREFASAHGLDTPPTLAPLGGHIGAPTAGGLGYVPNSEGKA